MVAIVTGGAQGIGRQICEELLMLGCRVVVADINKDVAEQFLNDAHHNNYDEKYVKFIKCDVTRRDQLLNMMDEAYKWYNRLDILVNNAGLLSKDPMDLMTTLETKLCATVCSTYKAIKMMSTKNGGNGGNIVNISSKAGLTIEAVSPFYTASEAGVVAFTRSFSLFKHKEEDGVRINAVCPSSVDTPSARQVWERRPSSQDYVNKMGFVNVGDVVSAFLKCIDGEKNGVVYSVTKSKDGSNKAVIKEEA